MKKVVLSFIFFLVVLLSFSVVSASWFSGAWGKMTGNVIVSKSDVLGDCSKGCMNNKCSNVEGFSKKMCMSRGYKTCLTSCKIPLKNSSVTVNKQVSKVSNLASSDCIGNVCKLYEGETVLYAQDSFSLEFISSNQAKFKMNNEVSEALEEKQSYVFSNNLKLLVIDIFYQVYVGGERSVVFSVHRNNAPGISVNCKDSDLGRDFYRKGIVSFENQTYTDYCSGNSSLKAEYYCEKNGVRSIGSDCKYGCYNGACRMP